MSAIEPDAAVIVLLLVLLAMSGLLACLRGSRP
jgi:hypothetical protein